MAKGKAPPGVQNKNIYTRASYLYQAAAFLATASQPQGLSAPDRSASDIDSGARDATGGLKDPSPTKSAKEAPKPGALTADQRRALQNMSRSLLADMRAVTLKLLIRQRPEMKRAVCRYCDALLVEGSSCDAVVENPSRGGRKPWADVLVVRCRACASVKRFPVGQLGKKQVRKSLRVGENTAQDGQCPNQMEQDA
ncbi:RNAse P, Rpr2/Rpp21 subunit [Akanthomyces lecanii RCEF 1005]|uniref:RNAse P, Rpr2/Rpp21 subunit n=1 Tax=Akanthomyces lecanii RCEF 1005 TaxID=1081108 RepID=A0A162KIW8_CORDF|nr:RNAse P, Rpr2/Rpp21 subunit [Akanthomyces lecanii RCEF 1005]